MMSKPAVRGDANLLNRTPELEFNIKKKLFSKKTILSFLFAILILLALLTRIDYPSVIRVLGTAIPSVVGIAFISFYFSIFLRAIRWKILLNNNIITVKTKDVSEILFIGWFVNVILPAKLGDLYRAYMVRRNYGASLSVVVGSVFTERVLDMFTLMCLFGLAISLSFRGKMPLDVRYVLFSGATIATLMVASIAFMKYCPGVIRRVLPARLLDIYERFQLGALKSIRRVPILMLYSVAAWLLEAGRLYLVTHALNTPIPFSLIIVIALASSILTTLPITPAGLGFVEVTVVGILVLFGVEKNTAVSIAMLDRIISYWSLIPTGLVVFLASKKC